MSDSAQHTVTLDGDVHESALCHHKSEGFFIVCGCTWRSGYSWKVEEVESEYAEHVASPDAARSEHE